MKMRYLLLTIILVLLLTSCGGEQKALVTFHSEGGDLPSSYVDGKWVTVGKTTTLPSPTKECYDFKGWYLDDIEFTSTSVVERFTHLYAKWEYANYVVKFYDDNNEIIYEITIPYNEERMTEFIPEKQGYTFESWEEIIDHEKRIITMKPIFYMSGLTMVLNDTEDGYIVSGYTGSASTVYIPSMYKGIEVVEVGGSAFHGNSNMENIKLPSTIRHIGPWAFTGCINLKEISIPEGITSIEEYTFASCQSLEIVNLPNTIEYIKEFGFAACEALVHINLPQSLSVIGKVAFSNCSSLKEISFPSSLRVIEQGAFARCTFSEIILNEGLIILDNGAFEGCFDVVKIFIPSTVRQISGSLIGEQDKLVSLKEMRSKLKQIDVHYLNQHFVSIDNNLYSKDGIRLIQYACGKEESLFVVPDTVTEIGPHCFSGAQHLEEIILPKSLGKIWSRCFFGIQNIKKIIIPSSVEIIYENAFEENDHLVIYCEDEKPKEGWVMWDIDKIQTVWNYTE